MAVETAKLPVHGRVEGATRIWLRRPMDHAGRWCRRGFSE